MVIYLSAKQLPIPKGKSADFYRSKYGDAFREITFLREAMGKLDQDATATFTYKASKFNMVELARAIDHSGELEPFALLADGFAAYRRFSIELPKGTKLSGKSRAQLRQAQTTIGAMLKLEIVMVDQGGKADQVTETINALATGGFGQIFPDDQWFED